jgi:hypothetical protein
MKARRPAGAIPQLTAAESERADSWLPDFAGMCLTDPEWVLEGDERKYKSTAGLHINMAGKGWYDHGADVGGRTAIGLVMHLKGCSYPQAVQRVAAFLAVSPGTGPCGVGNPNDDEGHPASAAECRDVLARIREDLAGTASEIYLRSRGLEPPYPVGLLGHLDDGRVGESALVAKLTEYNRITGVQLTYLTPDGKKSLIEPVRRRLNLEKSPGGAFRIAPRIGRPT